MRLIIVFDLFILQQRAYKSRRLLLQVPPVLGPLAAPLRADLQHPQAPGARDGVRAPGGELPRAARALAPEPAAARAGARRLRAEPARDDLLVGARHPLPRAGAGRGLGHRRRRGGAPHQLGLRAQPELADGPGVAEQQRAVRRAGARERPARVEGQLRERVGRVHARAGRGHVAGWGAVLPPPQVVILKT